MIGVEAGAGGVLGRFESGPLNLYGGYSRKGRRDGKWLAGVRWEF